jgi:hypothetical protein
MEFLGSSTVATVATDLSANVSSGVESVWPIALLAVSIPVSFYILRRLKGLFVTK